VQNLREIACLFVQPFPKNVLLLMMLETGKDEAQLRRLLNENEEVARQRDSLRKRLELMERAAREIMNFRV